MPEYERKVVLPSQGLLYDKLPGGEVQIRAMTTQEEKILASPTSDRAGNTLLDRLFKRCTDLPKDFPPAKLLTIDRFSLLLHLRAVSYGPKYQVSYNCVQCRKLNYVNVDLEEDVLAEEVKLEEAPPEEGFEVVLPKLGKTIGWRYTTGEDEAAADKQRSKLRGNESSVIEFRLARQIATIDGLPVENFVDLLNMVRKLSVMDNIALRDSMKEHEFGVTSLEFDFDCDSCGTQQPPMTMPVSKDFFRVVSPGD